MEMSVSDHAPAGNAAIAEVSGVPLDIEARGLVKRFDGTLAVDGVYISAPQGAIYGILGPNGAD
jgi:ABC-2 type transport system ATP-binding protein